MDYYSILDNSPSQAGSETAPPNFVPSSRIPSDPVPVKTAQSKAEPRATLPVRETLRFPGEDGGKSLSEMAQRDLDATLQLLAERAQYITGASGAAIALRQGETMVCCASSGPSAPELGAHLQIDSGLSAESVKTRQILRCDDAENDPRVNRESCKTFGIASVVVMPLVRGEEVYGVFELLSGRPRAFEERDFVALNRLAEMIQTAVEQADAARRTEIELAQPEVAVAAATLPAEVAAGSHREIVRADSEKEKRAPETEKEPTAAAPAADLRLVEVPVAKLPLAETHPVELHLSKPNLSELHPSEPHGVVPAVAVPAIMVGPALVETLDLAANAQEDQAGTDRADSISTIAFGNLRSCETCGFPVSQGRRLCLDCEAATPDAIANVSDDPQLFGEQAESNPSWVRSHVYLIATAVIALATIVLLAWRL
jgi:putative methionine-R-sulfoxide reductase with GAF domain